MYGYSGAFISRCSQAVDWLCQAFGFTLRLRIGDHRAQLNVGEGAIVVTKDEPSSSASSGAVMVRVDDFYRHSANAIGHGASLLSAPADYPYGERQYSVEDVAGHRWTFSQTVLDIDPQRWGGTPIGSND
jgi:uncharacterized glyoxalase superfamily protein PhnB